MANTTSDATSLGVLSRLPLEVRDTIYKEHLKIVVEIRDSLWDRDAPSDPDDTRWLRIQPYLVICRLSTTIRQEYSIVRDKLTFHHHDLWFNIESEASWDMTRIPPIGAYKVNAYKLEDGRTIAMHDNTSDDIVYSPRTAVELDLTTPDPRLARSMRKLTIRLGDLWYRSPTEYHKPTQDFRVAHGILDLTTFFSSMSVLQTIELGVEDPYYHYPCWPEYDGTDANIERFEVVVGRQCSILKTLLGSVLATPSLREMTVGGWCLYQRKIIPEPQARRANQELFGTLVDVLADPKFGWQYMKTPIIDLQVSKHVFLIEKCSGSGTMAVTTNNGNAACTEDTGKVSGRVSISGGGNISGGEKISGGGEDNIDGGDNNGGEHLGDGPSSMV